MAKTAPAWRRLVEEGLVASRQEAERWILSGRVRAGAVPVRSAGQPVPHEAALFVKGLGWRYAAKGGLKLEGALSAFGVDPSGRVCIDAGASTGGFTDCLLQHGAQRVYAVDVGYGQLAGRLRANPAVVNLERTNISDAGLLALAPRPTLGTVDLSYLSLRKAVPQFAAILHGAGDLVCLVKPLFETADVLARRTGVLSPEAYAPLLVSLAEGLALTGYPVRALTHSPVTGNHGTLEFFFHIRLGAPGGLAGEALALAARASSAAALSLPAFDKTQKETKR